MSSLNALAFIQASAQLSIILFSLEAGGGVESENMPNRQKILQGHIINS
jgi:hypothetical protein